MIYLTGDTPGDFQRLGNKHFPQCKEMTLDDYVIICGDFGGLWAGNAHDRYWLDWLNEKTSSPYSWMGITKILTF